MRKFIFISLILISSISHAQDLTSHNYIGEKYNYSIKFGWFKVGKVTISSSNRFIYEGGKRYFDTKITAGTAGLGGIFTDFKGEFTTKIDANTYMPVSSYRDMKSSESDNRRTDYYTFNNDSVHIKTVRHKNNKIDDRTLPYSTMYDTPTAILQCRLLNLSNATPNQSLGKINVFWNKTVYPVSAKYAKKEETKHNGKKMYVHKVYLYLPESGFLKDKKPVTAWLSADGRNVPLRFEAYTRYGTIKCYLTDDL